MLDDLDKELEQRGHKFLRYFDDCNIFTKSLSAAKRVFEGITNTDGDAYLPQTLVYEIDDPHEALMPCIRGALFLPARNSCGQKRNIKMGKSTKLKFID